MSAASRVTGTLPSLCFCGNIFAFTEFFSNFASMKKRILYIVNPHSGTQRKKHIVEKIDSFTDRDKFKVDITYTEYAGHATLLSKEAAAKGVDIVVAVGGDGTVNEVGRSIVNTETALAIIPCGSGNGLARHLQIPLDPFQAIGLINRAVCHYLDYGTINDQVFFCTCGIGFDAFISEKFASSEKRGLLTYVENTLLSGLNYKPQIYTIETGNSRESFKAFLLTCANASQYGNDACIAPRASMKDGLFDVVVITPFTAIEAPQVALGLYRRTLSANSHVRIIKAQKVIIHRDTEGIAHFDGDPFRTGKLIEVTNHPQGLKVVVNPFKTSGPLQPKKIQQFIPDFFKEWKNMPEEIIQKTGEDIKRINNTVINKIIRSI